MSIPPPFASVEETGAKVCADKNVAETIYKTWFLWPFSLCSVRMPTGSRQWVVEFRPVWKFSITLGFFWKH